MEFKLYYRPDNTVPHSPSNHIELTLYIAPCDKHSHHYRPSLTLVDYLNKYAYPKEINGYYLQQKNEKLLFQTIISENWLETGNVLEKIKDLYDTVSATVTEALTEYGKIRDIVISIQEKK